MRLPWGPTDDGRIKPDLVADGINVFSSEEAADNDYGTQSGTSMAAPNVTGTAALLLEHYRNLHNDADPRSSSLKGTLIHTAFDAGNTGPDYRHGWGLVNAASAATFLSNAAEATTDRLLERSYGGSAQAYDVMSDGTTPLKVSMVWTDPAPVSLPGAGLDDATSVLVNDLDLWVTRTVGGTTTTYRPWTLDPANPNTAAVRTTRNDRDNVEQVLIDAPAAGKYTIHVGRDPNQSSFSQDYSIMISGVEPAGDLNNDDEVTLEDLAILVGNFGKASSAIAAEGDVNLDGEIGIRDVMLLRNMCDCDGESLLGGGGGGEEMMGGGEGGGESLLSGEPARIYITTSNSLSGGGALPGTVPSALLDGPEDSVTLYVWATLGDYSFMNGYSVDIRATDEDVVKATASTIYNPDVVLSNYGNLIVGERWDDEYVTQSDLNDDGIGEELLVSGGNAFLLESGGGLNAAHDGSDVGGTLDELYDATSGAFLVQSFTLEALAGSAGLSTDILLYVGGKALSLDNLVGKSYVTFGLGENEVANADVGATDGTVHATISVAAEEPGALVMRVEARVQAVERVVSRLGNVRAAARARDAASGISRRSVDAVHSEAVDADAGYSDADFGTERLRAARRVGHVGHAGRFDARVEDSLGVLGLRGLVRA